MDKSNRERVLDLEKIRRLKQKIRRRKILLVAGAVIFLLGIIIAIGIWQVSQVTDSNRDFWGNFNSAHSIQQESPASSISETS